MTHWRTYIIGISLSFVNLSIGYRLPPIESVLREFSQTRQEGKRIERSTVLSTNPKFLNYSIVKGKVMDTAYLEGYPVGALMMAMQGVVSYWLGRRHASSCTMPPLKRIGKIGIKQIALLLYISNI